MNRRTQLSVFGAILGLATFLPGCDQGNAKESSKIQGTLPTDNLSTEERRAKSRGDNRSDTYPGAGKTPTDSSPRAKAKQ